MSPDETPVPPPPDAPPPPVEPIAAAGEPAPATPSEWAALQPAMVPIAPPIQVPPPSRRRGLLIAAGVVVALVVLVGVPVLLLSVLAKPGDRHAAGSPGRSASPSATPVSPELYQQTLNTGFSGLAASFARAGTLHSGEAVGGWGFELQHLFAVASASLSAVVPPAAVASAHHDILTALDAMDTVVGNTQSDGRDQKICGGSSALSQITSSPAATQLRGAVKELTTADPAHAYTVPAFLPDTTPNQSRQLGNGTVIKKTASGRNVLKVVNKAAVDAVVSWAPPNTKAAAVMVYIRAGGTATVNGVHDGSYDAYVTLGEDWDADGKEFTRNCAYQHLDHPIQLTSNPRQYSIDTMTLGEQSGNAPATEDDPGDFPV